MSDIFGQVIKRYNELLVEMPVTFKGMDKALATAKEIKDKNLPTSWPKPLVAINSDDDRKQAVKEIVKIVFGDSGVNSDIHDKKALQKALKDAIVEYSSKSGTKFARAVSDTFAGFLGNWLGTNLDVEITSSGTELKTSPASVELPKDKVKHAFEDAELKAAVETTSVEDATKQLKQSIEGSSDSIEPSSSSSSGGTATELAPEKHYEITEYALEQLEQDLEKANKRAQRYGIPSVNVVKLGERFTTTKKKHDLDTERTIKLVKVKLDLPAPKLPGGWKFVARIDHESFGNVIMRAPNTDEFEGELHKMYGASQPSGCDHCNRQRNRTNTFIVQDEAKKLKRVGRACLKDYVPGGESSAQKLVAWAELWTKIVQGLVEMSGPSEDSDGEGGGGGGSRESDYFQVEFVLGTGLFVSGKFGYLSAANARTNSENESGPTQTTSAKVRGILFNTFSRDEVQDKDPLYLAAEKWRSSEDFRKPYIEKAREILKWAPAYIEARLNDPNGSKKDYFSNLKVMVDAASKPGHDYVEGKHFGYLVSLVPMYNRAMESEKETKKDAEKKQSEYIGTMGYPIGELTAADKRKIKKSGISVNLEQFPYNGPIKMKVTGTRTFAGYYGGESATYMTSFEDENSSVYIWFATFDPGFKEGEEVVLERATVKNHKDYTNKKTGGVTKQTVIKRPKFQGQAEAE